MKRSVGAYVHGVFSDHLILILVKLQFNKIKNIDLFL